MDFEFLFGNSVLNLPGACVPYLASASAEQLRVLIALSSEAGKTPEVLCSAADVSEDRLAEAILFLKNHPEKLLEMSQNSYNFGKNNYASDIDVQYFKNNTPTGVASATEFMDYFLNPRKQGYTGFDAYLSEGQLGTDMSAFFGIMSAVSNNKNAFDSVNGEGLFSSSDVQNTLYDNLVGNNS